MTSAFWSASLEIFLEWSHFKPRSSKSWQTPKVLSNNKNWLPKLPMVEGGRQLGLGWIIVQVDLTLLGFCTLFTWLEFGGLVWQCMYRTVCCMYMVNTSFVSWNSIIVRTSVFILAMIHALIRWNPIWTWSSKLVSAELTHVSRLLHVICCNFVSEGWKSKQTKTCPLSRGNQSISAVAQGLKRRICLVHLKTWNVLKRYSKARVYRAGYICAFEWRHYSA